MAGNSSSVTRALTPEELKARGYVLDVPTSIVVKEPDGLPAPVPEIAPEQVEKPAPVQVQPEAPRPPVIPEAEPAKDWQPEIDAARKQGDEMRVWGNVARVGEDINKAFVPRAQGNSYAKDIEEMAGLPEKRVQEDITRAQQFQKLEGKNKPDDDPFSMGNTVFRQSIKAAFPVLAQKLGASFDSLTRPQIEKLMGIDQNQTKINETIDNNDGKLKIAGDKFEHDVADDKADNAMARAQLEAQNRHNQIMEQIALMNATRLSESHGVNTETGRNDVDNRRYAANLQALGDKTTKFSEITAALKNLDGIVPGITDGKIPKDFIVSAADRAKATVLGGAFAGTIKQKQEAFVKAQQDFSKIVMAYRSGLTVSEQERAYYDQTFGNKIWSSPVAFVNAVNLFKKYTYEKLATTQQAFQKTGNPDIDKLQPLEDWENIEGSISYRDPYWKGVGGPGTRVTKAPAQAPVMPKSPPVSTPVSPPANAPTPVNAAPVSQPPAQAQPEEMVPVISPDGKKGKVKKSQLDAALKLGFKLAQ